MDRSALSTEDLAALRAALAALGPSDRVPHEALAKLAAVPGLTLDLAAQAELGHPVVVLRPQPGTDTIFDALSPREREVAALLADGLTNRQLADRLFISVATVKDHVHAVLRKTGLRGRAAVAARWRHARPPGGP